MCSMRCPKSDIMEFRMIPTKNLSENKKIKIFDETVNRLKLIASVTPSFLNNVNIVEYPDNTIPHSKLIAFEISEFDCREFLVTVEFQLWENEVHIKVRRIDRANEYSPMYDEDSIDNINFIVQTFKNMVKNIGND